MILRLAALTLLAAAPGVTAHAAAAQSETSAASLTEAAERFASLFLPLDFSIKTALTGFDAEFRPAMSANPNVVALDAKFPGLIDAAGNAGRNAMEQAMRRDLPAAQRRIAALASARFSAADLADINVYLASPSGQRLQQLIAANADPTALKSEIRETGEMPQLNGEKLMSMVDPAVIAQLGKDELADLIRFGATPAGRKFDAAAKEFTELVATEMNSLIAAMKPDIEQAVVAALTAHLGR